MPNKPPKFFDKYKICIDVLYWTNICRKIDNMDIGIAGDTCEYRSI